MNYFINYNAQTSSITINTYRNNGFGSLNVLGLVGDIQRGLLSNCPLEGALAALEDGSIWNDAQQEIIENLHATILEFENGFDRENDEIAQREQDELDELAADY